MKNTTKYSQNYKRNTHPLIIRLIGLWRILTCKNFILIDYCEFTRNNNKFFKIRPLYRTNYDSESEKSAIKGAYLMRSKNKSK